MSLICVFVRWLRSTLHATPRTRDQALQHKVLSPNSGTARAVICRHSTRQMWGDIARDMSHSSVARSSSLQGKIATGSERVTRTGFEATYNIRQIF